MSNKELKRLMRLSRSVIKSPKAPIKEIEVSPQLLSRRRITEDKDLDIIVPGRVVKCVIKKL